MTVNTHPPTLHLEVGVFWQILDKSEYAKLSSRAGAWDSLEEFFENEPNLKEIHKETIEECWRDNCQSAAVMMLLTIRKLMEYAELD